jgi:hypothetical protein
MSTLSKKAVHYRVNPGNIFVRLSTRPMRTIPDSQFSIFRFFKSLSLWGGPDWQMQSLSLSRLPIKKESLSLSLILVSDRDRERSMRAMRWELCVWRRTMRSMRGGFISAIGSQSLVVRSLPTLERNLFVLFMRSSSGETDRLRPRETVVT